MKNAGRKVSLEVYNRALDTFISQRDLNAAQDILKEIHESVGRFDVITNNTLLKGLTTSRDTAQLRKMCKELENQGVRPDAGSYNCMLSAAASTSDLQQGWRTVEIREKANMRPTGHSVVVMAAAVKRANKPADVQRLYQLLQASGIGPCLDEVLFNALLQVYCRYRKQRVFESSSALDKSSMKPSLDIDASLFKACGLLGDLGRCRELWNQMVHEGAIMPNKRHIQSMLDRLVTNQLVDEAVDFLREWKSKSAETSDTLVCSTIIKGFAQSGRSKEAVEMKAESHKTDLVLYNTLMHAHAQAQTVDKFTPLLKSSHADGLTPDHFTYTSMLKAIARWAALTPPRRCSTRCSACSTSQGGVQLVLPPSRVGVHGCFHWHPVLGRLGDVHRNSILDEDRQEHDVP